MKVENKTLLIREAALTDSKILTTWWNDGRIMAHVGFPNGLGKTENEVKEDIESYLASEKRHLLIIESEGIPIGEMNYSSKENGIAEIGIKVCEPAYQGKGIGKAAVSMLIKYLFQNGYSKIVLDTALSNKRARHMYEVVGFKKMKEVENSWKNQLGQWQGHVEYELVERDFVDFSV